MLYIVRALNYEGIASPAGKLWSKNGVHLLLTNEVYTGALVWGRNAKDRSQGRSNLRPLGGAKVYHLGLDVQRKCSPATGVVRSP